MRNILLIVLLLANCAFSQEIQIKPFGAHMNYKEPYIADDGTIAILENNNFYKRHRIHLFDNEGKPICAADLEYSPTQYDPDPVFDLKNKCVVKPVLDGKIIFMQINFDGTVSQKTVKGYGAMTSIYSSWYTGLNSKGNIEMLGTVNANKIAHIEYNAGNQSITVHEVEIGLEEKKGTITFLGKKNNEVYFMSADYRVVQKSTYLSIFALNAKNEVRYIAKYDFPYKQGELYNPKLVPAYQRNLETSLVYLYWMSSIQKKVQLMFTRFVA